MRTGNEKKCAHFPHKTHQMMETASYIWFFHKYRLRTPTIKSTETDWNRDGKLDWVDMTIEMPADDHQAIYGVQLYLLFDVKLFVSMYYTEALSAFIWWEQIFWPIILQFILHSCLEVFLSIIKISNWLNSFYNFSGLMEMNPLCSIVWLN